MNFLYETTRLQLKVLNENHAADVLYFLQTNKAFFEPFEDQKKPSYYTLSYQTENLKAEYNAFLKTKYIRFYVFRKDSPNQIIGTISFSNLLPFPYSTATLGYKFAFAHQHMGYASEAVATACHALFKDAHFHRIEAFVLPDNLPSCHVLERIGFDLEGLCRGAININGIYRDHYKFALLNYIQ